MLISIPLDGKSINSKISCRFEAKSWCLIDFDEGRVNSIEFFDSFDDAFSKNGWIDFVVLDNKFENYIDIMDYGSMVLVRRDGQESVELIIEAFKFKELDEIGF
jgi:predicted Fe-Mo cluster-binding NifX family protein